MAGRFERLGCGKPDSPFRAWVCWDRTSGSGRTGRQLTVRKRLSCAKGNRFESTTGPRRTPSHLALGDLSKRVGIQAPDRQTQVQVILVLRSATRYIGCGDAMAQPEAGHGGIRKRFTSRHAH